MNQQIDQALVLAVRRGEKQAVERLVAAFQDGIFNYAYRLLQNRFDAQEVTQDTFIRAYHALIGQYDDDRCKELILRPWLLRIVRNLAANRRRKRQRDHEGHSTVPANLAAKEPTADQILEVSEECYRLEQALESLDKRDRELIVLRFIEDMRYAEIVTVVGTTEAAVRGKVFRALQKLRKIMTGQEENHGLQ